MSEERIITAAWEVEADPGTFIAKNGQYTNLVLNSYKGVEGLKPGEFITVKKDAEYGEAYTTKKEGQYGPFNIHSCTVWVGDQKATFVTFSDQEAEEFAGYDAGATIQISKEEFSYVDKKGTKRLKERLLFRGVQ